MVRTRLFEPAKPETEREFQTKIQEMLDREGWTWMYVRKMRTPDGRYLTGTSDSGWLDLFALRGPWILVIEVKVRNPKLKGVISDGQVKWLNLWHQTNVLVWVLWPKDNRQQIANWVHAPETAPKVYGWVPEPSSQTG